jgi:hypothetical protein
MGNSRVEINRYLRNHGFLVEEDHSAHSANYQVVDSEERASLIDTLVQRRKHTHSEKPKIQPRVATREILEFDTEDATFKKTKEDFKDE